MVKGCEVCGLHSSQHLPKRTRENNERGKDNGEGASIQLRVNVPL